MGAEVALPLTPLELLSCLQPLSHPRVARLTAPLGNGSQSLRSRLGYFRKSIFVNALGQEVLA